MPADDTGLLLGDGSFHPCEYWYHKDLFEALKDEGADVNDSLRLSRGTWSDTYYVNARRKCVPTRAQQLFLEEWVCRAPGRTLPEWYSGRLGIY